MSNVEVSVTTESITNNTSLPLFNNVNTLEINEIAELHAQTKVFRFETLTNPPLPRTLVSANNNQTIRVTRVSISNFNNSIDLLCNLFYRKEILNTNTFISFNKVVSRNSIAHIVDKANVIIVSNLDRLIFNCINI
jgi:hypothetical protein